MPSEFVSRLSSLADVMGAISNQHEPMDPDVKLQESSFYRAVRAAQGVVSICDPGTGDRSQVAVLMTRAWCVRCK